MTEKSTKRQQTTSGETDRATKPTASNAETELEAVNLATCIFYLDKDLHFIRVNKAFAKATGYQAEELEGKKFHDIFPIEEYQQLFCNILKTGKPYFAEGEPLEISQQYGKAPGYWDVAIHPILGTDGTPFQIVVTLADVTQRRESMQALKESNELFRHMFEMAPDANLLVRKDGTIAKINQEAEKLFGYRRDVLKGQKIENLIPEPVRGWHAEIRKRYMENPDSRRMAERQQLEGRDRQGKLFPVEVSLSPLNVEHEIQILVVVQDISQRLSAQRELQEKNKIVQLLRDVAVAANGAHSIEEALKYALVRICAFLDWPVGQAYMVEPSGITGMEIYHSKDPQRFAHFREASLKQDYTKGRGMVGRVVQHEGPEWLADIQTNPDFIRSEEAQQAGLKTGLALPILTGKETAAVLEFFTDEVVIPIQSFLDILPHVVTQLGRVVERVRAEEELTRSEARFRAIFEGSAIGILMTDINGRVVIVNPALEEMLYYPAGALSGAHIRQLLQAEEAVKHRLQVRALLAETGMYPPLELRYRRKDGSAILGRNVASVVYDLDGVPRYVITMVEDITQQKEMQDELAELRRTMLSNVENERIRLAQDIHDGPIQDLYVINMQLNGLLDEVEDTEPVQEAMNAVESVIGSLRDTITELRPPTLAQFGLERAIHSHAERLQEANQRLKIHLDLESDQQRLPQPVRLALFRNYKSAVSNVVRHAEAKNLWVHFHIRDQQAILEVEDDGRGFEFPKRLVDLTRGGHLGLVGMLERAESMGGKLEVKAEPGKGTRVQTVVPFEES